MQWLKRLFGGTPRGYRDVREAERVLIGQMHKAGNDPTRPNRVTHYLYFNNRDSADQARTALSAREFALELRPPFEQIKDWSVVASHDTIVSEENIGLIRSMMEALAAEHSGFYDGWEADVQPPR